MIELIITIGWGAAFITFCILIFTKTKKVNALNVRYLFILLWTFVIFLYNLRLSNLYNPSIIFNVLLIVVLFSFSTFTGMIKSPTFGLCIQVYKITVSKIDNYVKPMILLFLIGITANIYELFKVGAPIMLENKVTRGEVLHYIHYITNLTSIAISLAYIVFRIKKSKLSLFVMIVGIISLVIWLNRGSLLFFFLTIGIFELWRSIVFRYFKRMVIYLSILGVVFIFFFGYIGNLRTEYVMTKIFKHTINAHYKMSEKIPSELCHVYIYASSPLENARHIVFNQNIEKREFGLNLIYPFIAPLVKKYVENRVAYYPYLDELAGLNVSSFIDQALIDFGVFGIVVVYPFIFAIISILIAYAFRHYNEMTMILFISVIHLFIWSIFVNPFNNGQFMIMFFLSMFLYLYPKIRFLNIKKRIG